MTAFYFASSSIDTLLAMLITVQGNRPVIRYENVIGPLPATPAIPAGQDDKGNPTPAVPAAGILGNYYVSINIEGATEFPTPLPIGVVEDDVNGISVLGVWA